MPLERLTMFVLPREGQAKLIVPTLEATLESKSTQISSRFAHGKNLEDPIAILVEELGAATSVAVGDTIRSRHSIELFESTSQPQAF